MKGCNEIRRLIDEADQPGVFPFEVHGHISVCGDCSGFARERAGLRGLLQSGSRVSAPANFDALLHARLAERRSRGAFSWLSPAGMMRVGAAAAGVVIALLVVQFSGLLSPRDVAPPPSDVTVAQRAPAPAETTPTPAPGVIAPFVRPEDPPAITGNERAITAPPQRAARSYAKAAETSARRPAVADDYSGLQGGGTVLVRGQGGDQEVAIPAVSVGAQPLLYVSATRSAPRGSGGTSF
jgi:hypothetical protein